MKKSIYVAVVFAIIAVGLVLVLKTVKPQPVEILKPSLFERPDEIGAVIFRRFYAPLESEKIVVFGAPTAPEWHLDIVRGFLKVAAAEKRPFDVIVAEPQMPPLNTSELLTSQGAPIEVILAPMNAEIPAEFIDRVQALADQGKRVLVYTAGVFSSHLLKANPLNRLEKMTGKKFFSITSAPLAVRPDQEFLVDPPCVGMERDANGTADLGCAILQASRATYRKNLPDDKFVSMLNQQGVNDYLLMTAAPGQAEAAARGAEEFRMNAPGPFGGKSH